MSTTSPLARRLSLVVGALALAAAATAGVRPVTSAELPAPAAPAASRAVPVDAWLARMDGEHRQLFDAPQPDGGIPLVRVMNFYDTYNEAYGVTDARLDAVLTFYGGTTLYAVNDAAWAKYRIGEFVKATDPATNAPATANPWRTRPVILGTEMPAASVEALQRRGATFIACNRALTAVSSALAKARGLDPAAVHADLKANLLPGVELVPAMVVAVEQAHRAGLSYQRQ